MHVYSLGKGNIFIGKCVIYIPISTLQTVLSCLHCSSCKFYITVSFLTWFHSALVSTSGMGSWAHKIQSIHSNNSNYLTTNNNEELWLAESSQVQSNVARLNFDCLIGTCQKNWPLESCNALSISFTYTSRSLEFFKVP